MDPDEEADSLSQDGSRTERDGLYDEAADAVVEGDRTAAEEVAQRALEAGLLPEDVMRHGFAHGLAEVDARVDRGELFLPGLMRAAEAVAGAGEVLSASGKHSSARGRVVVGSVHGDAHDIGKIVVVAHLEAAGYEVADLGRNVDAERFVATARELDAGVICMSALPATTRDELRRVVVLIREQGLAVKTLVGGPLGVESYAMDVGIDAYARDAREAVTIIGELLGG